MLLQVEQYGYNGRAVPVLQQLSDSTRKVKEGRSNIFILTYAVFRVATSLKGSYSVTRVLAKSLKKRYNEISSYQEMRVFYDQTREYVTNMETFMKSPNWDNLGLSGRLLFPIVKRSYKITKTYSLLTERKIKQLDMPVYKAGTLFEKVNEQEAWEERCQQYALLA